MFNLAIQSEVLSGSGFSHAFFTRHGGVSQPPYDTLNFSVGVGDKPVDVHENARRAAHHLGVSVERLWVASQVHRADVHVADETDSLDSVQAACVDAIVSALPSTAIGVRIADCVPVLFADRQSRLVAAAHSGWRGTIANVVGATVARMREVLGLRGDILVAIGPHIEQCCFEVGNDVAAEILEASPDKDVVRRRAGRNPYVSLRRVIHAQLREVDIAEEAIDHVEGCTFCNEVDFFSYRRGGKQSGRSLAAIAGPGR